MSQITTILFTLPFAFFITKYFNSNFWHERFVLRGWRLRSEDGTITVTLYKANLVKIYLFQKILAYFHFRVYPFSCTSFRRHIRFLTTLILWFLASLNFTKGIIQRRIKNFKYNCLLYDCYQIKGRKEDEGYGYLHDDFTTSRRFLQCENYYNKR